MRISVRIYSLLFITLLCDWCALAQYAEAPSGYYPSAYGGDIFSGKVTGVDEASGQITISFKDKKKSEVFVGRLQEPCAVPSKDGNPMAAIDLPVGTDVTVFFEKNVQKGGSSSTKENLIIGIMFHSWDGHAVRQTAKKMYQCSHAPISNNLRCFSSAAKGCVERVDPITHSAQ